MSESLPPPLPPTAPTPNCPPTRGSHGSLGWFLAAGVVILGGVGFVSLLVISLGYSHFSFGSHPSGRIGAHELVEITLEDNGSKDKVAVLDIHGVISGEAPGIGRSSLVDEVRDQLQRMADDEAVKAVVLRVDSPGGEVLASDEIYNALRDFQTNNSVPIVACMGSLAASGGFYVSAPCRWIVAHPLTLTGSIGVIFHGYNYRGLMDKVGVRPDVVKSGKLKDMFSGELRAEEESPEEKVILKTLVTESFNRFKQVVQEGRDWSARQNEADKITGGRVLSERWGEFADGRILSGTQAFDLGLVDELGSFDTAVDRACSLAGLEVADVVTYETPPRFSDWFRLLGSSRSERISVELDGLNPLSRLPQGRLYFLSPIHLR